MNYFAYFPKYYSFRSSSDPKFNLLTFKMLNKTKTGLLTRNEFEDIYKTLEFKWSLMKRPQNLTDGKCFSIRKKIRDAVNSLYFDYVINAIILLNIICIGVETAYIKNDNNKSI